MLERFCCILIGYILGCILTAEIVSHAVAGKPCAQLGTGNPGMANIAHCLGVPWGIVVLAGDIGKTFLACWLGFLLAPGISGYLAVLYAGLGCILGHNLPFWHLFKGGKGVTVTCASVFVCSPFYGILANIAGFAVVLVTGYLPLGAVVIPAVFTVFAFIRFGREAGILSILYTVIMIWRHFDGLKSVKDGTCPKIRPFNFLKHKSNPQ